MFENGSGWTISLDPSVPASLFHKMSEDAATQHNLNNINDSDFSNKNEVLSNSNKQGGRIRFFKEGKFILEIKRTCEGDKCCWVSVSKKTYWPPQDETISSSTSISSSDDNSSSTVCRDKQFSPWHVYHSKKQKTPSSNISKNMTFYFYNAKVRLTTLTKKLRRPFDPSVNVVVKVRGKKKMTRQCVQLQKVIQALTDKLILPRQSQKVLSPRKRSKNKKEQIRNKYCTTHEKYVLYKPIEDLSESNHNSSSHLPFRENKYGQFSEKHHARNFSDKVRKKTNAVYSVPSSPSYIYPHSVCYSNNYPRKGYAHPQIYTSPDSITLPQSFSIPSHDIDSQTDIADMPLNLSKHTI